MIELIQFSQSSSIFFFFFFSGAIFFFYFSCQNRAQPTRPRISRTNAPRSRITCTPAHYAHICNPGTCAPDCLPRSPSRSPGHLRAWMLARLRLDAGTLTRSPGISALRPGLLRCYVHLAALSYCELYLTALSHPVILRICPGSSRFCAIACTRSLCRFTVAALPRPPRPPFAPAPVG